MFGRSLCDEVLSIIKRWTPKKKYTRETEYSDELAEFIRKKLKESQQGILFGCPEEHYVKREGGRSRADIEVDGRIGIELKRNLRGKTEMNRLMGQLSDYEDEYKCIIVVLCGEMKEETITQEEIWYYQYI